MKKIIYILIIALPVTFFSCQDFFTVEPENFVLDEQSFEKETDAMNAIYGVYALMQPLVDQIWLFGEAQGDLVVAGPGADKWIAEIAQNRVTPQNPYTDYTNFYKVIIACHKAMEGLANIRRGDPVNYSQERYEINIAEIIYARAWIYLTLVKIWDRVPYLDHDVTSIEQIHQEAPVDGQQILKMILSDVEEYASHMKKLRLPATRSDADIVTSHAMFTQQSAVLLHSEIYLYMNDLIKAWEIVRPLLPWGAVDQHVNKGISTTMERRFYDDLMSWADISCCRREYALYIDFDGSKGQKNSLQKWTNNTEGGIYAVKPSTNSVQNYKNTPMILLEYQRHSLQYIWHQVIENFVADKDGFPLVGLPEDMVRGDGVAFYYSKNDTIIFKYLLRQQWVPRSATKGDDRSNDDARFVIYRSGMFYYLTIEMLNNMGDFAYQAFSFLNGGEYTPVSPRYRAAVYPFFFDPASGMSEKQQMNKFLLEEMALEYGYEGLRWFDLVRFSKRPGYETWLADRVAQKYPATQREAIREKLKNPNYWYFPYYEGNIIKNSKLGQKPGY